MAEDNNKIMSGRLGDSHAEATVVNGAGTDAGNSGRSAGRGGKASLATEIVRYLLFGVLTTAVSMVSNFGILWGGQLLFNITDTGSGRYFALYSVAKVVSWVCAVLFAFFTNKKWVFKDSSSNGGQVVRQLCVFAGGRVVTLGLDYLLNYLMLLAMNALALSWLDGLFGITLDKYNELVAWFVAQVAVVISNYFISKLFVFNRGRHNAKQNK